MVFNMLFFLFVGIPAIVFSYVIFFEWIQDMQDSTSWNEYFDRLERDKKWDEL